MSDRQIIIASGHRQLAHLFRIIASRSRLQSQRAAVPQAAVSAARRIANLHDAAARVIRDHGRFDLSRKAFSTPMLAELLPYMTEADKDVLANVERTMREVSDGILNIERGEIIMKNHGLLVRINRLLVRELRMRERAEI